MPRGRIFYGWYVVVASGIGLACGIATVIASTFPIFVGPMREELGWTQANAFTALFVATTTAMVFAPIVGATVDRWGAKRVILLALASEVLVLASFRFADASLPGFYARFFLLASIGQGTTHVAFARVVSLWFDRRRGLALGITLAGLGAGGAVWPLLSQAAIEAYGWRDAYLVLAAAVAIVGFPVIGLVLRESPAAMGLAPDGAKAAGSGHAPVGPLPGLTLREALATPRFWLIVAAFLLIGIGVQSVMLHLVPMLKLRGVTPMLAALGQSLLFIALVVGRLAAGWLMDRFFAPRVAIAFLVGPIAGLLFLALGASGPFAFLAGMLAGLAAGAEVDVTAYLGGRYFGLRYFSRIYAWFYAAYSFGAGLGPLVTAQAVDRFGEYTQILYVHAGLLALACLLLMRLGPFPRWEPEQAGG